jgi:drug/metabolite transporter (DMT)-like permease
MKARKIIAGILVVLGIMLMILAPETMTGIALVIIGVAIEAIGIALERRG